MFTIKHRREENDTWPLQIVTQVNLHSRSRVAQGQSARIKGAIQKGRSRSGGRGCQPKGDEVEQPL